VVRDDGSFSDVPWSSVFDPAANARALSAIQAEGFRAASKLVDRFVGKATSNGNGANGSGISPASTPSAVPAPDGISRRGVEDVNLEHLMKTWWLIVGQFLTGSARMAAAPFLNPAADDSPTLDLGSPRGEGTLELEAEPAGRATAEVWLHNRGPDDLGEIVIRCSDLLAHDGGVVEATAMHFEPDIVPMPKRSSRGVSITVALTPAVRPGVYRGTLLAGGKPDLWLPVVLSVRIPGS
jgi:hypothetical protein